MEEGHVFPQLSQRCRSVLANLAGQRRQFFILVFENVIVVIHILHRVFVLAVVIEAVVLAVFVAVGVELVAENILFGLLMHHHKVGLKSDL